MPRRRRNRGRPPQLVVVRDTETVFRSAILEGVLSAEPSHARYAGHYLYMFHDEAGVAWFKHRDTREYLSMRAIKHAVGDEV